MELTAIGEPANGSLFHVFAIGKIDAIVKVSHSSNRKRQGRYYAPIWDLALC